MEEREASPWDSSDTEEEDGLPVIMVTKMGGEENFIRLKDSGWVVSAYGSSTPKLSSLADPGEVVGLDLGLAEEEVPEKVNVPVIKMDLLEVPMESYAMHTYESPSKLEREKIRESRIREERQKEREKERQKINAGSPSRRATPSPSPSTPPVRSPRTSPRPSRNAVTPMNAPILARPAPGAALHCVRRKKTTGGDGSRYASSLGGSMQRSKDRQRTAVPRRLW